MTENKRFTMCHEQNDINGWTMSIVDWQTKQPFDYTTYEVHSSSITSTKDEMEDLCLLLNELAEENEQLKQDVERINDARLSYKQDWKYVSTRCEFLEEENKDLKEYREICTELEKENEQLKKELHLIHIKTMFSTVKSFKGDVSKRYKYSKETDTIYDTANHYGQYDKVLDKAEIVMLLNEYETVLNELKGDVE